MEYFKIKNMILNKINMEGISDYICEFVEYYIFNFFEKPHNIQNFIKKEENKSFQEQVDKLINDTIYEIKVEKEIKILEKRYEKLVKDCEIINNNIGIQDKNEEEGDEEDDDNNNNDNGKIGLLV
jgi:hypothetical protein